MTDLSHRIRLETVRPVLSQMGYWSEGAEELLMMVAAHESGGFMHRRQIGGPALGLWQMEPVAFKDLYSRYFLLRPEIRAAVRAVLPAGSEMSFYLMESDDRFACAMARAHFIKAPEPIPTAEDLYALAVYAKLHWNTMAGKATAEKYLEDHRRHVIGEAA